MHVFLTGPVQIGKSTLLRASLDALQPQKLGGFRTVSAQPQADGSRPVYLHPACSPDELHESANRVGIRRPGLGIVSFPAAFTFGTRGEKFRAACEAMGALAIPHGDAGFQFDFLGGYRMQLMVYAGDEEFPPSSQVLYSDNFETGFAAEDRVVAGDILISAIKARM